MLTMPYCFSRTLESGAPEKLALEQYSFEDDEGCQLIPVEYSIACHC